MPRPPQHVFILRLALASMLALYVPWVLGPGNMQHRAYAVGLALLTVLAGVIRRTTHAGGLAGDAATAAMGLLLLTPAIAVRAIDVSEAVSTATQVSPERTLLELPSIAQSVPLASGPLLLGAGLAILIMCGRLGAVFVGILVGAAAAAWFGKSMALEAGAAMLQERFADAVLYSQAMRFVGASALVGALAGVPFYVQGKRNWRVAMHALLRDQRLADAQSKRDAEIARLSAARAEHAAREAAKAAQEEQLRQEAEQQAKPGLVIEGLGDRGSGTVTEDAEPSGSGAVDEAHPLERADSEASLESPPTTSQVTPEPHLDLEPRFDIESPIVVEVDPEESNPDAALTPMLSARLKRVTGGLAILCTLAAAWTATPPWFEIVAALPDVSSPKAVPVTDPGLSIASPPMDPLARTFDQDLARRGHMRILGAPWSCLNDSASFGNGYGRAAREIEQLAVPADTPVIDLYPAVQMMRRRGVFRMGLLGRADPPYGPLGALFAWPSVPLMIDRPPRALQWFRLGRRTMEELPLVGGGVSPQGCALLIDDDVSVSTLFSTARSLGSAYGDKRCAGGIALVFPEDGSTTNSNPAWRGCP